MRSVEDFYNEFPFEKIITTPPPLVQEFLDGEIEYLREHILPNKAILEVGCGYGRLLKILSERAVKAVGIDFSRTLLNKARKHLRGIKNIELHYMNAKRLKFPEKHFDYSLCLDATFGNMPGIEVDVLKEMKRVTNERGQIIVSVFSENAKPTQIENYTRIGLKNVRDDGIAVHTDEGFYSRRFTKENLQSYFEAIGLTCTIIKICPINYIAIAEVYD